MRFSASIVSICVILSAACGGSVTERTTQALGTALGATNAARDQFTAWDKDHQLVIVDAAKTREAAEKSLSDYRGKRQKIVQAFTVAYTSIASAAAMVPLVEAGTKKDTELLGILADAVGAVQTVVGSIQDIKKAFDDERQAVPPGEPKPATPKPLPPPPDPEPAPAPAGGTP